MVELVQRAQRGEHEAFEVLARASIDRLYGIARRVLRDPAAAEDAVQDCLVRAWRDLRALRDPARFDAWLYRLLLNACRDEQRRSRRRPAVVTLESIGGPVADDQFVDVARRDEIARGFARLSIEHRLALTLHLHLGLGIAEIARILGVPEGTATSRIHYGTRALRAILTEAAPSPASRGAVR